ncbi:MAG: M1 family metallopeptidase [Labilithrix sp.]|nr:M1 family metallopeptidase [Labilithrix sp.]
MARSSVALSIGTLALAAIASCVTPPPLPPPPKPPPPVEQAPPPPVRADGRLPALATPVKYALAFEIDPRLPRHKGTTTIEVEIPAKTSHVVLNARALDVTSAKAIAGGVAKTARVTWRAAHGGAGPWPEELVLGFDAALEPGHATLVITYEGPFDDELSGLYRVSDRERWYAFTQFEATGARRAFPCFDEPGYKVPFEISVTVPKGMIAIGNTPEIARDDAGDKTRFRFAPTAPLPSYLVALAIGELEIEELARTQPPVRLVTTKGKTGLGALALEATSGIVDALARWFGIPYPYEKLDIVAVPEFAAGAMENVGLVTFREELLLLDPARASARARRAQAVIIAHELAHQWFGNLVTAEWWDDLWLNEGFATWMQWRVTDLWRPAYGARLDAVTSLHDVMDLDGLASARAVRQPVTSTSEAHEAFDGITYEKGAAILSTIEHWMGPDAFQRGVRDYLTSNAHRSVRADRLLSALDRASGKDVTSMAAGFLDRPGVPQVSAQLECERGARWHAELAQEPWRPLGSKAPEDPSRAWVIPVCVLPQGEKKSTCAELAAGAPSLVAGRSCPGWIHPNAETSYYRFTLSEAELMRLAAGRAQLDVAEKISLLSNAWAQVRAGKLPAKAMLKLLPMFDDETERHVVEQIASILGGMSNVLVQEEARPAFRRFALARLAKRKRDLGWLKKTGESADGDEAILRRAVLTTMGDVAEDDATLREAEEHAARWLADPASVDADTATIALDLSTRHAGAARLDQLLARAREGKTREDRITALRALAGFDDPATFDRAMSSSLSDEIRPHDMRYVLGAAYGRRRARPMTEAWVRAHWDELVKKLPGSLGVALVGAAGVGCSRAELEERAAFYTPRTAKIEGAARPLGQALENVSLCAELRTHGASALTRELLNTDKPKK